MGSLSLPHIILLAVVALVLFGGRNKISDIMGDVAKGIRSFKKGLSDDDEARPQNQPQPAPRHTETPRSIDHYPPQQPVSQNETVSEPRKAG